MTKTNLPTPGTTTLAVVLRELTGEEVASA